MRQSRLFAPTLKESPADAEIASHKLLLRGGFMRRVASGIYDFLPLGVRVLRKIERIIREEMNREGAQEVILPILQPRELWEESGRWSRYGDEMMRLKDRAGRDFGLGPTHEEVITALVRDNVSSYRDLPLNLYQIGAKFRDEVRPRFGLLRAREFIMKDAYSFDRDEEGMRESYRSMYRAYSRIFDRCGVKWMAVEADTGLIGGDVSHEFMVMASVGEDRIAHCEKCGYAANVNLAGYRREPLAGPDRPLEKVSTPGRRTVEEVSGFLDVEPRHLIKCLMYLVEGRPVAVLVPGDREAGEVKLERAFGTTEFRLFNENDWEDHPQYVRGFVGPVGLDGVEVLADISLEGAKGMVCGSNSEDHHLMGVEVGRDFQPSRYLDLTLAREGDPCPQCGDALKVMAGIEVGQIFQLGLKYSQSMGCTYTDERGQERPVYMGCYGIGVTRLMAAVVEQHHDEKGIRWPLEVAPAHVHLIPLNYEKEERRKAAEDLYRELLGSGLDVLLDDREESAGVKFADADLFGIPFRLVLGRVFEESGMLELQIRATGERAVLSAKEAFDRIKEALPSA